MLARRGDLASSQLGSLLVAEDGVRQRDRILWGDERGGSRREFREPTRAGCDDRDIGRHGFQCGHRHTFCTAARSWDRGQEQEIGPAIEGIARFASHFADESDARPRTCERGGELLELAAARSVASDDQVERGISLALQSLDGAQESRDSLDGDQAAEKQQRQWLSRWTRRPGQTGEVSDVDAHRTDDRLVSEPVLQGRRDLLQQSLSESVGDKHDSDVAFHECPHDEGTEAESDDEVDVSRVSDGDASTRWQMRASAR